MLGVSSGACLALLAGMARDASIFDPTWRAGESARIRAVVEVAGTTDFLVEPAATVPWQELLVTWFIGGSREELPDRWGEASPVTHARADGPPIFILHGAFDLVAPVTQALFLRDALEAADQPYVYFEVPYAGHETALWDSPATQQRRPDILAFLRAHL